MYKDEYILVSYTVVVESQVKNKVWGMDMN